MNIIFVKPRQSFESYVDYYRLVTLSEFETCYTDEIDLDRNIVYIASPLTVEWCLQIDKWKDKSRSAHLILWNLERPAANGGIGNYNRNGERLIYDRYFDEIWISDRQLARESGFRFVILGSDTRLGQPGMRKRYDVAHMSYINCRREKLLDKLNINIAPNAWGKKRDRQLKKTRFGLNIHQDQYPYQEPLRMSLFAAYGLPIVSEIIYDPYPFTEKTLIMAQYSDLSIVLSNVLANNYWTFRQIGLAARRLLCRQYRFGDVVRTEVEKSIGYPISVIGI